MAMALNTISLCLNSGIKMATRTSWKINPGNIINANPVNNWLFIIYRKTRINSTYPVQFPLKYFYYHLDW